MDKGYYLVNKDIPPLVALAYICCDGDPGFTLSEAIRLQQEDPNMIVVNRKGEIIFPEVVYSKEGRK